MANIVKGYPHKPTSPAVASVMRGFVDNLLLKPKHLQARKRASTLRHDFSGAAATPNDTSTLEEVNYGNN